MTCACTRPSATRTETAAPVATSATEVSTWPSSPWSTAYPRCSVASGDSARARARWWAISSTARSSRWTVVRRARSRRASTSSARLRDQRARVGQGGPGPQRREQGALALEPARQRRSQPLPADLDDAQLLGHVGDDELGGVGRRGGADVGDQVEQRLVGLVADRRHDGGPALRDGTDQALVGERQQVLDRPAAAGDDDHVDALVAVEAVDRGDHLGRGARALHGGVRRLEGHRGPAASGVLDHVALGGGVGRRDQADPLGQEGQAALELGGEQPLGREQLAAALEPGEQLAEADEADLAGGEGQGAAVGVVRGLRVQDHAGALDQRRVERVEQGALAGDRDRDVGHRVAERQEDGADARAPADLRHLALDPHRAEPVDPAGDRVGDLPDGRGSLR